MLISVILGIFGKRLVEYDKEGGNKTHWISTKGNSQGICYKNPWWAESCYGNVLANESLLKQVAFQDLASILKI